MTDTNSRYYGLSLLRKYGHFPAPKRDILLVSSLAIEVACSKLSDSGEDAKVKGTRKVGSFLPLYFRHRALSIQRAQLSRSLEQAAIEDTWVLRQKILTRIL